MISFMKSAQMVVEPAICKLEAQGSGQCKYQLELTPESGLQWFKS
jgi:hypothetical protein